METGAVAKQAKTEFSVTPKGADGCVVVFHEVWGLVEHTEDVCKRVGKLGFAAIAPNLFRGHERILTPDNIQKAMEGVWELSLEERRDKTKVAEALNKKGVSLEIKEVAATLYDPAFRDKLLDDALAAVERANSKFDAVTTLGFCIFYGEPPITEDVAKITVPILDIHANEDEIINKKVPAFVGAMLEGGKDLTLKTYPRTKHGFFNDTRESVYDRKAAGEAWDIMKWFLERNLRRH